MTTPESEPDDAAPSGASTSGGPEGRSSTGPDPEDVMSRGIEAMQAAATEMIGAARAMLDVAEEMVQDPKAMGTMLGAFTTVARAATRFAPGPPSTADDQRGPDDGGDGGVQRIPVS